MFKSLLQELCHGRRWAPPVYEHTRDGPDHAPLFRATIVVQDKKFSSPNEWEWSAKEADNLAAMVAFEHLTFVVNILTADGGTHIYQNHLRQREHQPRPMEHLGISAHGSTSPNN